jgi:5-hydroxyisourate hydrolase
MGRLTTHVLDTMRGKPAAGMVILLEAGAPLSGVKSVTTNADGRVDSPLLEGAGFGQGGYQLVFDVGNYFRGLGVDVGSPAFLETVVLRFEVQDAGQHYHVPLLVSPYAYSTYRGS